MKNRFLIVLVFPFAMLAALALGLLMLAGQAIDWVLERAVGRG